MADATDRRAIASLTRMVLNFRIIAVLLTVLWTPYADKDDLNLLSIALVAAAGLTLVPLLTWDRIGSSLMRHPTTLLLDLMMAFAILWVTGPESPFFYFTLGTALLSGMLYRYAGAALFSTVLVFGYLVILIARTPEAVPLSFQSVIGLPALYPILAVAGAALRDLLRAKRDVEDQLDDRTRTAAAADERARLAREMHDSLAKTIHGIALSASALPHWVERAPERAADSARQLASAANRAAGEARELIGDLRSDRLDQPLAIAVRQCVQEWSAEHGIPTRLELDDVSPVAPEVRYEAFCILKEALRNVARHAQASLVHVALSREDDEVTLVVSDDGRGLGQAGDDLDALAAADHYGLVGMAERARRVGGRLVVAQPPEGGVRVTATVSAAGHPPPGRPAPIQEAAS